MRELNYLRILVSLFIIGFFYFMIDIMWIGHNSLNITLLYLATGMEIVLGLISLYWIWEGYKIV